MDFARVATRVILLGIVVAALAQGSLHRRRCPRGLLLLAPLGAYAAIHYSPQLLGAAHAARVFAEMLPPQLRTEQFGALARQLRETICMGVAGTLGGALIAMPASIVMARHLTTVWLAWPLRRVMEKIGRAHV